MNIQGINSIKYFGAENNILPHLKSNDSINLYDFFMGELNSIPFMNGTCSMKVKFKEGKPGVLTLIKIKFTIAEHPKEVITELNRIKTINQCFVVTDNMKQKYLIGFKKGSHPKVSYSLVNDATGKGSRSISGEINLKTPIFPVYITD